MRVRGAAAEWAVGMVVRPELVIADQRDAAVVERYGAHAVRPVGHDEALVHAVAEARDDAVGKALGQVEQAGRIGSKRAVAEAVAGGGRPAGAQAARARPAKAAEPRAKLRRVSNGAILSATPARSR